MSIWIKIGAVAIAAAALFLGGYRFAAALYSEDIAQMREQAALALAKQEQAHREKERKSAQALAEAWDKLAKASSDTSLLSSELDRVRKQADDYQRRLSGVAADSCSAERERLGKCVGLLREGAELSGEGAELSGRIAARKDALLHVVRP